MGFVIKNWYLRPTIDLIGWALFVIAKKKKKGSL